jgi:predicted DNA binding CopG/RHH family protein
MKDEKITIRIAEEDKELLKTISAKKDIPMSQLIREAIKLYIQEENKK